MARTFVEAGRRRQFTPSVSHGVGALSWKDGFFGVNQDDAVFNSFSPSAAARDHMHILDGVWDLPYGSHASGIYGFDASIVPAGKKINAVPINQASSLTLYQNTASLAASAVAIGRVWATAVAGATFIRVVLFGPENQY
jgi:hypothetical protein